MHIRGIRELGTSAAALVVAALFTALVLSNTSSAARNEVRELAWEDLVPSGWDPRAEFEALVGDGLQDLTDESDDGEELFDAYLEAARSAPVVDELDGEQVRLPGFVVPLEYDHMEVSEFLLVPYFGACIHVPPPPANQIVYVKMDGSFPVGNVFKPVWVTGVISVQAYLNDVGDAGYTMRGTSVDLY